MDRIDAAADPQIEVAVAGIRGAIHHLNGDLTRIVYLSTLRDNNAGTYFHPVLSQAHGVERANYAFTICHRDLFGRFVRSPARRYVDELKLYIKFAKIDVVPVWRSLEPYRGTVPLGMPQVLQEIYFHNIETALLILESAPVSI
jgi:hypothetical protein